MPVGLVISAILLLESEPIVVFTESSSNCEVWVSEKDSSSYKTSNKSVLGRSLEHHGPVEVVVLPVFLEINTLLDDSLFLSSVEAASVADRQLEPGSGWVSMRKTTFVISPVLV